MNEIELIESYLQGRLCDEDREQVEKRVVPREFDAYHQRNHEQRRGVAEASWGEKKKR